MEEKEKPVDPKSTRYKPGLLLADLIEAPMRLMTHHRHLPKEGKPKPHGYTDAGSRRTDFLNAGQIRNHYPNFDKMGFTAQAFIDINISGTLKDGATTSQESENPNIEPNPANDDKTTEQLAAEDHVRKELRKIPNIILVYTVFGDVDLRVKVVGLTLKDIERTVILIRGIDGVTTSKTAIIIDETDYKTMRRNWAQLIRNNREKIERLFNL